LICGDCEGTDHPRIVKARETMLPWAALEPQLRTLISLLDEGDTALAIEALQALVPEFRSLDGPGADVHPRPSLVLKEVAGGS
jgi:hypothetical protein